MIDLMNSKYDVEFFVLRHRICFQEVIIHLSPL